MRQLTEGQYTKVLARCGLTRHEKEVLAIDPEKLKEIVQFAFRAGLDFDVVRIGPARPTKKETGN
jgi:hypothetical protein